MRILFNKSGNSTILFLGAVGLLSLAASTSHISRLAEVRNGFRNNRLVSVRDSIAQRVSLSSELPGVFRNSINPDLGNPNPELKACLLGEASCLLDGTTVYPISLYAPGAHATLTAISGGNQPVRYDGYGKICGTQTATISPTSPNASSPGATVANDDCIFEVKTSFTAACIGSTPTNCSGIELRVSYTIGIASSLKPGVNLSPISGLANPVSQQNIFPPLPGYTPTLIRSQLIVTTTTTTPTTAPPVAPVMSKTEQAIRNTGLTNETVIKMILDSKLSKQNSVELANILLSKETFPTTDIINVLISTFQKDPGLAIEIGYWVPGSLDSLTIFNSAVAVANSLGSDINTNIRDAIIDSGVTDPVFGKKIYDAVEAVDTSWSITYALALSQITDSGTGQRLATFLTSSGITDGTWGQVFVTAEIIKQGITDPATAKLMWQTEISDPAAIQFVKDSGFQDLTLVGQIWTDGISNLSRVTQVYNAIKASGVTDEDVIYHAISNRMTNAQEIQAVAAEWSNPTVADNSGHGSGSSSNGGNSGPGGSSSNTETSTTSTSGTGSTSTVSTVVTVDGTLINSCTVGVCTQMSF